MNLHNSQTRNTKVIRSATARRRSAAVHAEKARKKPDPKAAKKTMMVHRMGAAAFSAFLLLFMILCVPVTAKASGLSILTELLQAATTLATQAQSLAVSQASQVAYNQTIVAPPAQLHTTSLALTSLMNTYNSVMSVYNLISTHSATLPQTIALENSMFSTAASSIHPQYVSVYGAQPTAGSVTTARASQIDMADSTANEALALANSSDQAQTILVNDGTQELNAAANAAPGTADMQIAQSAILELHSKSIQHHLLAAMLRQQAMQTATKMANVKQAVTSGTTSSVPVSIP